MNPLLDFKNQRSNWSGSFNTRCSSRCFLLKAVVVFPSLKKIMLPLNQISLCPLCTILLHNSSYLRNWNKCFMLKRTKNHIFIKEKHNFPFSFHTFFSLPKSVLLYRILLASRSDSKRVKISPCRTGPLTFRVMVRLSSTNSTRTWVHWPWEPVRPTMEMTLAYRGWLALSMVVFFLNVVFSGLSKLFL